MEADTIAYLIGLGLLVVFELRAVLLKKGNPISYHIKAWRDKSSWRRWGIAFGFAWMIWHFSFQGY